MKVCGSWVSTPFPGRCTLPTNHFDGCRVDMFPPPSAYPVAKSKLDWVCRTSSLYVADLRVNGRFIGSVFAHRQSPYSRWLIEAVIPTGRFTMEADDFESIAVDSEFNLIVPLPKEPTNNVYMPKLSDWKSRVKEMIPGPEYRWNP